MRTKRWLGLLLAMLLVPALFALAACGDDDDEGWTLDRRETAAEPAAAGIESNPGQRQA